MKTNISLIILATVLGGCATFGTDFDWGNVEKIKVGMTYDEVRQVMGPPTTVTAVDSTEVWQWVHSKANFLGDVEAKSVQVPFRRGFVTEVPTLPSEVAREQRTKNSMRPGSEVGGPK